MADDIFDFGFTTASEDELMAEEKKRVKEVEKKLTKDQSKAQTLFDMIHPLLENLRANPEKEYIYWPDREDKIDEFEARLVAVLNEET